MPDTMSINVNAFACNHVISICGFDFSSILPSSLTVVIGNNSAIITKIYICATKLCILTQNFPLHIHEDYLMKRNKILAITREYVQKLKEAGISPSRFPTNRSFNTATLDEILSHAHYLACNLQNIHSQTQYGKLNRHFTAIQMCLSFAGWYTLDELMQHNRPT